MLPAIQPGAPVFRSGDEQIVIANPVLLFTISIEVRIRAEVLFYPFPQRPFSLETSLLYKYSNSVDPREPVITYYCWSGVLSIKHQ